MADTEKCKHEYKEVVTKKIVPIIKHFNYKDNLIGTVEQESITIFCINCGDSKPVLEADKNL